MGGLRPLLSKYGLALTIEEQSEVFGNATGGVRRGLAYDGVTTATLQMDTQAAFGWSGGLFNASALQIHGRNLSADNLLTLQTASGIEADVSTRLWELWYQQKILGDNLDVKIGQQSLDQEFMISQNANYFINTSFGWPVLASSDMPGGGPAYPLSSLGVRVRARPNNSITFLAGVFNGSPVANNLGDPQKNNPAGISFPLNGGALAIAELQFATPAASAAASNGGAAQLLPGVYKIGVWYDSENFNDVRYDNMGVSLASPTSTGIPAVHRGDYAIYAVADQMIYRFSDDPGRTVSVFLRPSLAPQQDRNFIAFSLNGGLTMHGLIVGRNDDVFGLAAAFTQVSTDVTGLSLDAAFYNPNVYTPVRRNETVLEATYQYQVTPWCQLQPDIQYVFNPGAGIANPESPNQKIKNEAVFGARATLNF